MDTRKKLTIIRSIPKPDGGAPAPVFFGTEFGVVLSYAIEGEAVDKIEPTARITFKQVQKFIHHRDIGEENIDEYYFVDVRQLVPYGAFEIASKDLEDMTHLIFAFHDSTFEIVCHDYNIEVLDIDYEDFLSQQVPSFLPSY